MIGGVDKYFQIAPCFRDEDPRADRHSCEFYQVDCEMSFVEQDDVFDVAETFVQELTSTLTTKKITRGFRGIEKILEKNKKLITHDDTLAEKQATDTEKFIRLTHTQAQSLFGSDKPDIRFDMHFEDFTDTFAQSDFTLFQNAISHGGVVKAMKLT